MHTRLVIIAAALVAAFVAAPVRAANNFSIDWHEVNAPKSCLKPGLVTEGQANFDVNTVPIPTYSDKSTLNHGAYGAFDMWFHAPFSGTLFRIGTNQIAMGVYTSNDSDYCTTEESTVWLRGPGVDRLLFRYIRAGMAFSGETDVSLSLREIDPQLADSLEVLKKAIEDARARLRAAGLDADTLSDGLDRLAELEALLDDLLDRGWGQLTAEELNQIMAAYDDLMPGVRDALVQFLADLQRDIDELRQEIERIGEVFRQQVDHIDGVLSGAPGWDPSQSGGFDPVEQGEFPPIDVPAVLGEEPWSPSHDPYASYADQVIETLQATVSGAEVVDRLAFVTVYSAWRENIATLELVLQMRSTVAVAEWGAFLKAKTRVLNFLHQYVDGKGWLKDSPIPPAVKEFVEILRDLDVAYRFKQRAEALQLELNLYTNELTERQQAALDVLLLTDRLLRERLAQEAPDEKEDGFWDVAVDIVDGVISMTPVGDFLDACRAITGKEGCWTGRPLTTEERVLSGLGVVIGSGAAWKAAAGVVSKPAMGVLRKLGDVMDEIVPITPVSHVTATPVKGGIEYLHDNGLKVRYNRRRFPDFTPYTIVGPKGKCDVRIKLSGSRKKDFELADAEAGFTKANPRPPNTTWHHHEDLGRMILVPTKVNNSFPHTGGVAIWQKVYGETYKP